MKPGDPGDPDFRRADLGGSNRRWSLVGQGHPLVGDPVYGDITPSWCQGLGMIVANAEKMGAIPLWDFTRHWLHVLLSTLHFFFGGAIGDVPQNLQVFERFPKHLTTHDHSKQR